MLLIRHWNRIQLLTLGYREQRWSAFICPEKCLVYIELGFTMHQDVLLFRPMRQNREAARHIKQDLCCMCPHQDPADDWTEHISSSGKKYYYNCRTEVSQWEKPKDLLERQAHLNVKERFSSLFNRIRITAGSESRLLSASGNKDRKIQSRWRETVSPGTWTTDKRPCRTKPRQVNMAQVSERRPPKGR